ncbi:MAG: alpha-glucan family phosphorylase, partial [Planctomycetota bacterium]
MSQVELSPPAGIDRPSWTDVTPEALYAKLNTLARNLWWSWHPEVISLFRDLDPLRWRQLDHNPIALLAEMTPEQVAERAGEMVMYTRINQAHRRLHAYLNNTTHTWGAREAGILGAKPVAYFSAEFGIHECVPIYSGGLGVLSGDHIKSTSGLGVPMVAIGLFYDQGYFKQHLNSEGYQEEEYLDTKVEQLPMEPAIGKDGNSITVSIDTRDGTLLAKVWLMRVGRVKLYLLDCDVEGNSPQDRELTSRLYGGDHRTRIRQELVLGVGGVKAIRALGIDPGVYHLNEGHSAFAPLEVMRDKMETDGLGFDDALREVAQQTCFTTHTPVPAGHDRFDAALIEEHIGPLRDKLGISHEQLMGLGRVEPQNDQETFCMTVIGLKLSRKANAVSSLHGKVSRRMWAHLWPWRVEEEVPIGHITNGVHVPSWLAQPMRQLYDKVMGQDWEERMGDSGLWQKIYQVER